MIDRSVLLLLAASCLACSDDGNRFAAGIPVGLAIVSGDSQISAVASSAAGGTMSAHHLPDALVLQILIDTTWTPVTIFGPGEPDIIALPSGTVVQHQVTSIGCGAPSLDGATPDANGQTATFWEIPGSRADLTGRLPAPAHHEVDGVSVWAAHCLLEAALRYGDHVTARVAVSSYFTPGPVQDISVPAVIHAFIGDTTPLPQPEATDEWGNPYPADQVVWAGSDDLTSILHDDSEIAAMVAEREGWDTLTATIQKSAEMVVAKLERLSGRWRYSLRCFRPQVGDVSWRTDSIVAEFVVDSVRHRPGERDLPVVPHEWPGPEYPLTDLRLFGDGSLVFYPDSEPPHSFPIEIYADQAPQGLRLYVYDPPYISSMAGHPLYRSLSATGNPPDAYSGMEGCVNADSVKETLTRI